MAHESETRALDPEPIVVDLLDRESRPVLGTGVEGDADEQLLSEGAEDVKSGAGHRPMR